MATVNDQTNAKRRIPGVFTGIISALLILLFVYTAVSKLMARQLFALTLWRSPLLQKSSELLSWAIPLLEIFISVLLFSPKWRKAGFILSTFLMACFTIYIGYMIIFIPNLPCSCGGVLKQLTWNQHLAFNTCFTLLSMVGWVLSSNHKDFVRTNRISRTPV